MQIAILGAGMVGRAMAIDLAKKYSVTSFDLSKESLQILSNKNKAVTTVQADLSDYANYATLLSKFDFIITAVPGFMGYKTYLKPFAKIYTSLLRGLDAFGFLISTFEKTS